MSEQVMPVGKPCREELYLQHSLETTKLNAECWSWVSPLWDSEAPSCWLRELCDVFTV